MPEILDALDGIVDSVGVFAVEDPQTTEPVAWRVELFGSGEPDLPRIREALAACVGSERAVELEVAPVPATDWVLSSGLQIEPVEAGRFLVHGAKDRARLPFGRIGIEIEAGLAFGSGEHPTTRACLLAIDWLARHRSARRVLDLGCGSGVLAIAAARCWPARVIAADLDAVAVRVAGENARQNGVAGRITAVVSDGYHHPVIRRGGPYDLILANILSGPLVDLAPALSRHLAPGGAAVLSGLLDRQASEVLAAHQVRGMRLLRRIDLPPWVALVLVRPRANRHSVRRRSRIQRGVSSVVNRSRFKR